jgi:WD40 repeat protein
VPSHGVAVFTGKPGSFEGHQGRVNSVTVLPDGRRALSGSTDKTLRLWDLETGAELTCLTFDAVPFALKWSEQMGAVIVGDGLGLIHVVELLDPSPPPGGDIS